MYCLRLFVVVYKLVMLMLCWIVCVYQLSLLLLPWLSCYIHKYPSIIMYGLRLFFILKLKVKG